MPNGFKREPMVRTTFAGKAKEKCVTCVHEVVCSERCIKNVKTETDSCQWTPSKYKENK